LTIASGFAASVVVSAVIALQSTTGTTASTQTDQPVSPGFVTFPKQPHSPDAATPVRPVFLSLLTRAIKGRDITLKASSAPPIPQHGPHTQPPCA
jgi:hypothetical protein